MLHNHALMPALGVTINCNGLLQSVRTSFNDDVNWQVCTCTECATRVYLVEGRAHHWNYVRGAHDCRQPAWQRTGQDAGLDVYVCMKCGHRERVPKLPRANLLVTKFYTWKRDEVGRIIIHAGPFKRANFAYHSMEYTGADGHQHRKAECEGRLVDSGKTIMAKRSPAYRAD